MSQRNGLQTRPAQDISTPVVAVQTREAKRQVDEHRQCPLCYGGLGGVGQSNGGYQKASTLRVRYYKCDRCAHTWSIYLEPEKVVGVNANLPATT